MPIPFLDGGTRAALVIAERVLLRAGFSDCLTCWRDLPDNVRARAWIEFPTLTAGRYSLHERDLNRYV